jgi:hypothetical protein
MSPIPSELLNRNGFSTPEQERIDQLAANPDFTDAKNQRDQIATGCKYLREFEGLSRFTFDAIGRRLGVKGSSVDYHYSALMCKNEYQITSWRDTISKSRLPTRNSWLLSSILTGSPSQAAPCGILREECRR